MSVAEELGSRLRVERERQGMSVQKAADELRLDVWVIDAFESGDFTRAGPPVYAKGHLKKYASLLGMGGEPIAAALESLNVSGPEPMLPESGTRIAARSRFGGRRFAWRPIATLAVLGAVIVGVLWWKPWRLRIGHGAPSLPAAVARPHAPSPASPPPQSGGLGVPMRGASTAVIDQPAPVLQAAPPAAPPPATAAAAAPASLQLRFSKKSWVDVRDAAGKLLYDGIDRPATTRTITGQAPFAVILGDATGVAVSIGGHLLVLSAAYVNGNVGRFDVDADGGLRPYARPLP
ncbi:MAG: helix-turn-helix domain-containing protein [Steroidobacteraceae bacterium]|nr:helix-turn-helix domain-containing protein [Steroidobacteraceae bacterium]